jgi:hypothetical protein
MTAHSRNLVGTRIILHKIIDSRTKGKDAILLYCGEEGSGKSNLMLTNVDYIDELLQKDTPIEHITRTLKELAIILRMCKDEEQVALDEGSELASDNQYEAIVKSIKKAFTVMREKKLIVHICFTNPNRIHTYFREDRVKGIFFMKKQGLIYFYTRSRFQQIMNNIKKYESGIKSIKTFTNHPPSLIDTFPPYKGKLLKEYLKRKKENIQEILDELYSDFGVNERVLSLNQACKYLGVGDDLLRKYIRYEENNDDPERVLPIQWNLAHTKMSIKEKDLTDFKVWYALKTSKKDSNDTHIYKKEEKNLPEADS